MKPENERKENMKVKNKVIVVTGGGNGVGRELVLSLIERGAKVAAIDMNETSLLETEKLIASGKKENISLHVLNISDKSAVEKLPKQVVARFGSIDGLINNAGIIQPFIRVSELDYSIIERVFNVNFFGTLYMTKAFLPFLTKQAETHLVNVSSMGGFFPFPGQSIYGAAKAAVKLLTEGLQSELANTKVKVTIVFPGAIGTNIMANSGLKNPVTPEANSGNSMLKSLPPKEAARIIIDAVESNKSRVFVGKDSKMLDLMYRINPKLAVSFIAKKMKSHLE